MDQLGSQAWTVLAIIAGVAVLSVLHVIAAQVRNHHQVHDLRVRVNQLRAGQVEKFRSRGAELVADDDPSIAGSIATRPPASSGSHSSSQGRKAA